MPARPRARLVVATLLAIAVSGVHLVALRAEARAAGSTTVRGAVTDPGGHPVAGARVVVRERPDDDSGDNLELCCIRTVTAADGTYAVDTSTYGSVSVQVIDDARRFAPRFHGGDGSARGATQVPVGRGTDVEGVDVALSPLTRLTGRLTGADGRSVAGTRVRLFDGSREVPTSDLRGDTVGPDGRFDVRGVDPGSYRVLFDAPDGHFRSRFWGSSGTADVARPVTADGAPVVLGDVRLVVAPPLRSTAVRLGGRARVGRTLFVRTARWDVPRVSTRYQWLADGRPVPGMTESSVLLRGWAVGRRISVRVVGTTTTVERSAGRATSPRTIPVRG